MDDTFFYNSLNKIRLKYIERLRFKVLAAKEILQLTLNFY